MKEMPSQRLTVWPAASFSTNVSSRVFLVQCAISLRASFQEISCQSVAPGRRTCGLVSRRVTLGVFDRRSRQIGHRRNSCFITKNVGPADKTFARELIDKTIDYAPADAPMEIRVDLIGERNGELLTYSCILEQTPWQ